MNKTFLDLDVSKDVTFNVVGGIRELSFKSVILETFEDKIVTAAIIRCDKVVAFGPETKVYLVASTNGLPIKFVNANVKLAYSSNGVVRYEITADQPGIEVNRRESERFVIDKRGTLETNSGKGSVQLHDVSARGFSVLMKKSEFNKFQMMIGDYVKVTSAIDGRVNFDLIGKIMRCQEDDVNSKVIIGCMMDTEDLRLSRFIKENLK